jgi:hypothetical protein
MQDIAHKLELMTVGGRVMVECPCSLEDEETSGGTPPVDYPVVLVSLLADFRLI